MSQAAEVGGIGSRTQSSVHVERRGRAFTPPTPGLAPERVGGIGVLPRVKRNAFSAFPERCFDSPVVRFPLIGRDLILANAPEAMRHVRASRTDLSRRVAAGDRVLGRSSGAASHRARARPGGVSDASSRPPSRRAPCRF